ncbi:hypothetical protein [Pseudoduganella sp. R-43]|jgi:hypothetical protein|uniref:hypothetical protein n=1 Tax=unclassified Pseudoduganella TaxID=2637179 RepID=UPI003CED1A13
MNYLAILGASLLSACAAPPAIQANIDNGRNLLASVREELAAFNEHEQAARRGRVTNLRSDWAKLTSDMHQAMLERLAAQSAGNPGAGQLFDHLRQAADQRVQQEAALAGQQGHFHERADAPPTASLQATELSLQELGSTARKPDRVSVLRQFAVELARTQGPAPAAAEGVPAPVAANEGAAPVLSK